MSGEHAHKSEALLPPAASLAIFRSQNRKKGRGWKERRKEGREGGGREGRAMISDHGDAFPALVR
jgi:hypothetical protein